MPEWNEFFNDDGNMIDIALNIISKHKLDVNAVSNNGETALSLALSKNHLERANILYKNDAIPNNIFEAIAVKNVVSIKRFITYKK